MVTSFSVQRPSKVSNLTREGGFSVVLRLKVSLQGSIKFGKNLIVTINKQLKGKEALSIISESNSVT